MQLIIINKREVWKQKSTKLIVDIIYFVGDLIKFVQIFRTYEIYSRKLPEEIRNVSSFITDVCTKFISKRFEEALYKLNLYC